MIAELATLSIALTAHAVAAEEACPGAWARLLQHAGSYDTDSILNDREVAAALSRLLGAERDHLLANLSVRGAADLVSCDLVIEGNADHRGAEENGIVAISLTQGSVAAAMLSAGRIKIYRGRRRLLRGADRDQGLARRGDVGLQLSFRSAV